MIDILAVLASKFEHPASPPIRSSVSQTFPSAMVDDGSSESSFSFPEKEQLRSKPFDISGHPQRISHSQALVGHFL